jgi:hypothetical protein
MNTEKQVCVRRKSDGMPFKVAQSEALNLIKDKPLEFARTSKGYTRSFYRRMAKTMSNQEAFDKEKVDFSTKQKKNFVEQDGDKVIAWRFRGTKTLNYEIPKEKEEAEAKQSWIKEIVEKACINPNDKSLKQGLLSKLAIFFGFLSQKKTTEAVKESVDLPLYQRYVLGYGKTDDMANLRLA